MPREPLMSIGDPRQIGGPDGYVAVEIEWSQKRATAIRQVNTVYYQNRSDRNRICRVESRSTGQMIDVTLPAGTPAGSDISQWAVFSPPGASPVNMDETSARII